MDKYLERLLAVNENELIVDSVTNTGDPSSWRNVTRRMKVISEWNGGRLILVDMPNGVELRRQNKHEFWNKEWIWNTNLTLSLTDEEVNKIKGIVDGW